MNRKIDAMIVGVEKAGTTSLLRYLSEHAEIKSHSNMEMPFFVDNEIYENGWDMAYKQYFSPDSNEQVILAKSVGCMYWQHAPQRLYIHNPDMKLIAVLRNPVERAYSAYWYAVQMGREDKERFEEGIEIEDERLDTRKDFHLRYHAYLHRGLYGQQLLRLSEFFSPEQVKIIIFEEFKANPQKIVNEIFEFLEVSSHVMVNVNKRHNETSGRRNHFLFWFRTKSPFFRKMINSIVPSAFRNRIKSMLLTAGSPKKSIPPISNETRNRLLKFYKTDINKIEKILDRDLNIWL